MPLRLVTPAALCLTSAPIGSVLFDNVTEWHERVEHVLENIYATTSCTGGAGCHEVHDEEHFSTAQVLRIIELVSAHLRPARGGA